MKRSDGTICNTPGENTEDFQSHFSTDGEVRAATRKLKNALGESGIMPQVLKCLLYHQETFLLLKTEHLQFWDSETVTEEWKIGHLIILPKKGDLSLPKYSFSLHLFYCGSNDNMESYE